MKDKFVNNPIRDLWMERFIREYKYMFSPSTQVEDDMSATRYDFEVLAKHLAFPTGMALAAAHNEPDAYTRGYMEAVDRVCAACYEVNARFDAERFYNAIINGEK